MIDMTFQLKQILNINQATELRRLKAVIKKVEHHYFEKDSIKDKIENVSIKSIHKHNGKC